MGRAPLPAARRRAALTFALAAALAAGLAAPASPARAEDVPASVAALGDADAGAREKARAALVAGGHDDDVVQVLRAASLRDTLAPEAVEALCDVAGERRLAFANSGLRSLLRDAAKPLAVRRAAARALERTGSIADVGALGDALADVPAECSRALASIGGDAARAALVRGGGDPPSADSLAARLRLGDRDAMAPLLSLLADPRGTEYVTGLLRWATGRDLPADPAAWLELSERLALADRLGSDDVDAAHATVRAIADSIRPLGAGGAPMEERVAGILADERMPVTARCRAALVLGVAGVRTRNDLLLRCCANQQPGNLRWAAANALARVGDLSCAVPLAFLLVHDEDRDRLNAKRSPRRDYIPVDPEFVRVLTRLGLPGGPLPLFDLMAGEYRSALQRDSLRAVQELSGGDGFGFDTDSASKDRKASVERMRAWFLDARTSFGIAPRADDPGWPKFRADVDEQIAVLGQFKFLNQMRARKALTIVAEGAKEQLVAGLASDNLLVRTGVAEVMQFAALRDFAEPLAARIASEPHPAAKKRMLEALETCGRPARDGSRPGGDVVRAAVRAALADRVIDVRIAAVRALAVVGDRAADPGTLRNVRAEPRNATDEFRAKSAQALLALGDRSALGDVVRELRSEDFTSRFEAARSLAAAGIDLRGYDADLPSEAREAAVRAIESDVPDGGRK